MGELIGLVIVLFVVIPIGIGFLIYFIPKRMGYPKVAKYLIILYGLIVLSIIISEVFKDKLFSKKDALELVEEQGIELKNDFQLINNESMSSIGDYYHTFTLQISASDKAKIIHTIKESDNFKTIDEPISNLYIDIEDRYNGTKRTQNYETKNSYIREYIESKEGYAPTYRRITIFKDENKLMFEDIDY